MDTISILAALVLAIIIIVIAAYFLQQWLVLRSMPARDSDSSAANTSAEILYFEEKLKDNYGYELPTTRIKTILAVPESQDRIILLEDKTPFQNLMRVHSNGWIVWRAELPTSNNDVYTHMEWQGQELKAFSASCYLVTLNLDKGEILSFEFTK
jgi:hypothetical protein